MASSGIRSDGGFEAMLASMRQLAAQGLDVNVAAGNVDAFMRAQLAKRETPEGEPWPLTEDGRSALAGAAAAYEQRVVGNAIVMKVGGGEKKRYAVHNFGAGYQKARRQLPAGRMPTRPGDAIRQGFVEDFRAKTKAGKRGYRYYKARGWKITRASR